MALIAGSLVLAACSSGEPEQETAVAPAAATAQSQAVDAAATPSRESQARAVISEDMPYAEVGDELVYGYFVAPSDMFEPLPAVIMIHEWWGLTDEMRARGCSRDRGLHRARDRPVRRADGV